MAPSSASWVRPLARLLALSGLFNSTRRNSSGAKLGMPVKRSSSPLGEGVADLDRAVVGQADDVAGVGLSTISRSRARNTVALPRPTSRPSRQWNAFMPRSKRPEQIRRNAMRSRWFGSMFAWILNTKPLKNSSVGGDHAHRHGLAGRRRVVGGGPVIAARGSGGGARRTNASKQLAHAEVVHRRAEQQRGLLAGVRKAAWSKGGAAPLSSSTDSRSSSA
jgi:hypothetical protein